MAKKRILVLASGDKIGGGSGFQEMVEFSRTNPPVLNADVIGVVSNHPKGGVFKKAKMLGIPFDFWTGPFDAEGYRYFVKKYKADYVMCSGWLKFVRGLEIGKTINIHPGPLPEFGGPGMYGHFVHEAVIKAYLEGRIKQSAVTIHFVDEHAYDHGPVIRQFPVLIRPEDTPETLASRVNEKERAIQSEVVSLVVNGYIYYHEGKIFYRDDNPKRIYF